MPAGSAEDARRDTVTNTHPKLSIHVWPRLTFSGEGQAKRVPRGIFAGHPMFLAQRSLNHAGGSRDTL